MPTARITKTSVDAAKPESKDWLLWDDRLGGFGLKVTPAGSKVYIFQYRMGGRGAKVRRFTIGKHGKLTTEGARKKAEVLALSVANGVDPQREKVREVRKAIDFSFLHCQSSFGFCVLARKHNLAKFPKFGRKLLCLIGGRQWRYKGSWLEPRHASKCPVKPNRYLAS